MNGPQTETDRLNARELAAYYERLAADLWRTRLDAGGEVNMVHAESVAYLRRKTGWSGPIASAALDAELRSRGEA